MARAIKPNLSRVTELKRQLEKAKAQAASLEQHGQVNTAWHEQVNNLEKQIKELETNKESSNG